MGPDGSNQRQITRLDSILLSPAVSPDGSTVAFTSYADSKPGNPKVGVFLFQVDPPRRIPFRNRLDHASNPSFTPDGAQFVYSASPDGRDNQVFISSLNGGAPRAIAQAGAADMEAKVNPRNPDDIVFVPAAPGRPRSTGPTSTGRLSRGSAPAREKPSIRIGAPMASCSHSPGLRGFAGKLQHLLHGTGQRPIHPVDHAMPAATSTLPGPPNGVHIVFQSDRTGSTQIFMMLADGSHVRQLTGLKAGEGENDMPAWSKPARSAALAATTP